MRGQNGKEGFGLCVFVQMVGVADQRLKTELGRVDQFVVFEALLKGLILFSDFIVFGGHRGIDHPNAFVFPWG